MIVPHNKLDLATLNNVIESFVLREGTDYGHGQITLAQKMAQVRKQLDAGEAHLTWDPDLETCNIISKQIPHPQD